MVSVIAANWARSPRRSRSKSTQPVIPHMVTPRVVGIAARGSSPEVCRAVCHGTRTRYRERRGDARGGAVVARGLGARAERGADGWDPGTRPSWGSVAREANYIDAHRLFR
ncbi:hypothetical protein GCM10010232_54100 [Streptomyces amakusaensis]